MIEFNRGKEGEVARKLERAGFKIVATGVAPEGAKTYAAEVRFKPKGRKE